MSEISSRPRVHSVRNLTPQVSTSSNLQTGASLVGSLAGLLGAAVVAALSHALKEVPVSSNTTLPAIPLLRERHSRLEGRLAQIGAQHHLSATDSAKMVALTKLAASPLLISADSLRTSATKVLQADTPLQVRTAEQKMWQQAEQSHHKALVQSLTVACSRAAIQVGFGTVETSLGPLGMVRVIATDEAGRSLATEIGTDQDGYPSLETEVIGVSDGSCHAILDAFDQALEVQGIRAQKPKRTFTGGVCQLATAREFINRRPRLPGSPPIEAPPDKSQKDRRTQRLNPTKRAQTFEKR